MYFSHPLNRPRSAKFLEKNARAMSKRQSRKNESQTSYDSEKDPFQVKINLKNGIKNFLGTLPFGKKGSDPNFLRFGRSAPANNFLRFGKSPSQQNFLRFGKRNADPNFLRFGKFIFCKFCHTYYSLVFRSVVRHVLLK